MPVPQRIRLVIVDDHALIRQSLAAFLGGLEDIDLVGQGADGREAIQLFAEHQPDVLLMDLIMPGMNGILAAQTILGKDSCAHILLLTSFNHIAHIKAARQIGALGCLSKAISLEQLASAVRLAGLGQQVEADAEPPARPLSA
jgi:DNA-binding NarL/FixJ family response regulator